MQSLFEVWQTLSSDAQAAIIGGIGGGAVGGAVGGIFGLCGGVLVVFVERHLRGRGDVYIQLSGWSPRTQFQDSVPYGYGFDAEFFNNKDLDTALWNVEVEFYKGDARQVVCPVEEGTESARQRLYVLPLPSRVTIRKSLTIYVPPEHKETARDSDRRVLIGTFPGGRVCQQEIPV